VVSLSSVTDLSLHLNQSDDRQPSHTGHSLSRKGIHDSIFGNNSNCIRENLLKSNSTEEEKLMISCWFCIHNKLLLGIFLNRSQVIDYVSDQYGKRSPLSMNSLLH